jgi:hypothetical protein
MHIAQLLDPFARRPYVEIIEASLPHVLGADREQFLLGINSALTHGLQDATREALFDRLHNTRWIALLRLADQDMNVVGHGHVAYDYEAITLADLFEHCEELIATLPARQPGLPMITTASNEMQVIRPVVALGMVGHRASLLAGAEEKL